MHTTPQNTRNLILIGFMGTGKTTIGKRVAKSLGFRFVDTDDRIARKAGKSIPKIFEDDGEEAFRELETAVLERCAKDEGQVISTGGGIVTQERNCAILREAGFVVWLKASPETIFDRVRRNRNRPLLQTPDPKATIQKLLRERDPLYGETADLFVTTDGLTLEETSFGVCESVRVALGIA